MVRYSNLVKNEEGEFDICSEDIALDNLIELKVNKVRLLGNTIGPYVTTDLEGEEELLLLNC